IMYHKGAIESSLLQAYISALLFSLACSLIRLFFSREVPNWVTIKPAIQDGWSTCLQTLDGLLPRLGRLASASSDHTIKVWDASSGECLQTLEGHSSWVKSMVFSHDSAWLASASHNYTVKVWDASSGSC
ncbi:NWD1 protein, partial [Lindgomyces ingoldianus]